MTKRKYRLSFDGWGCDVAVGAISKEAYDFWKDYEDDDGHSTLWMALSSGDYNGLPREAKIGWEMGDGQTQKHGGTKDLVIEEEAESRVISLHKQELASAGIEVHLNHIRQKDMKNGFFAVAANYEQGDFGSVDLELDGPIDISKISLGGDFILTDEIQERIFNSIAYDGRKLELETNGLRSAKANYAGVFENTYGERDG